MRYTEERGAARKDCKCEPCKFKRGEANALSRGVVQGYAYSPRGGWRKRHVRNNPVGMPEYGLGVELETTQGEDAYNVSNEYAAGMRLPKTFWVPKHDGSVSGPEFASQPATLAWWYGHKREISKMFDNLLHAGYRSHVGGEAGMHVNVGVDAFDTPDHLFCFISLVNVNSQWALRMSQRTAEQAGQWANIDRMKTRRNRVDWAAYAFGQRGYSTEGRYLAVNKPERQNRFEFRLPRGTLRIDRFYKNLEWTIAMIEFTRTIAAREHDTSDGAIGSLRDQQEFSCTPPKFMAWVMAHAEYPYLRAFLTERFAAQITAEAVA